MVKNNSNWEMLNRHIIQCHRCSRLVNYIHAVAETKVRRFQKEKYWGKPIPGFGDVNGRLLIIGLAPAAHGGNRTGRMFTGDSSGDWLIRALFDAGFSNQPISQSRNDGLILRDAFITAPVRCAPPKNRPTSQEITNCSDFLLKEWRLLKNIKVILALGHIAFDVCLRYLYPASRPKPTFQHGKTYEIRDSPILIASYHPSRQNTQTGRLSQGAWKRIFSRIVTFLE